MTFDHEIVLFDLDGTISDNSVGIVTGIVRALAEHGITDVTSAQAKAFIGPPLRVMFPEFGVAQTDVEEAVAAYRRYYDDIGWAENVLYPGVVAVIDALVAAGRTVATATSKPEPSARKILDRFGLEDRFTYIGAATLDGSRDHKVDVVRHTIEVLGADPSDCVMIGDRNHDIDGARAAGVHASIGVTWGFGDRTELRDAGATAVVDTAAQLARALSMDESNVREN